MNRQGRYTRRVNRLQQSHYKVRNRFRWFRELPLKKKIMVIGLPIAAILLLVPIITYLVLARDISDPERLMNRNNTGIEMVDINNEVFFSSGTSKALKRLKLDEISQYAQDALISSEDKDFYKHSGISLKGLVAALYANVVSRDATAYGGSTITQQLVKKKLLSDEKTFFRKYQEVAMAVAVDRQYSKKEILDMYLNSVYFGEGAFGIDEASQTYFGKPAIDLDLAESAMLVGLLPAPSAYSPISGDREKSKVQQERVLRRMAEDGKITEQQRQEAADEELAYQPAAPDDKPVNAPHFVDMVVAELDKKYGENSEEIIQRSGYRVKTTLNLDWQKKAEAIVAEQTAINARSGGRNAALVAIDPANGEIRSLVGSADYSNEEWGKFNAATAKRQPGSSFKPIYFAEAIEKRMVTPGEIIRDEATDFNGYKPDNYDFRFRGDISVRNALAQSLNIPAVKVMQELGVKASIETAQRMGIKTITPDKDYGLSLALGAAEARPLDMTNAYAAFAAGGNQYAPTTILEIENKYGEVIHRHQPSAKRVQSAQAAYLISHILSDNTARAPTFGNALTVSGRTVAVKTGSTDDNRDAWTIGYTPSIAVGVWVGNNENETMNSGGSSMAGPIWRRSIAAFLGDSPDQKFARPNGIVDMAICRSNGLRATGNTSGSGVYTEVFVSGTTPTDSCETTAPPAREQEDDDEDSDDRNSVRDSDGDGVRDNADLCPGTARGTAVSSNGCPRDSDSDGIADDIDKCPNEGKPQTGERLGADGCIVEDTADTPPEDGEGGDDTTTPAPEPQPAPVAPRNPDN